MEKIDDVQVDIIADSLKSSSEKLNTLLDSVRTKMKTMNTEETLKSEGAQRIAEEFEQLYNKFENFYTQIGSYSKFLKEVVQINRDTDQAVKSSIE